MFPSPNSTYDYPSFMTKGCLFCTWYHSSCAFFVYHLTVWHDTVTPRKWQFTRKKKCSYKYLLYIQFMYHKLDSDIIFFFFYVGTTTISPIANILIDLQEKTAILGALQMPMCSKIQKGAHLKNSSKGGNLRSEKNIQNSITHMSYLFLHLHYFAIFRALLMQIEILKKT